MSGRTDPAARAAFLIADHPPTMGDDGARVLVFVIERDNLELERHMMRIVLQTQGPIESIAESFEKAAAALRSARDYLDAHARDRAAVKGAP